MSIVGAWRRKLPIAPPLPRWERFVRPFVITLVNSWTRKDGQGWHYRSYSGPIGATIPVPRDPKVGDRTTSALANFWNSDVKANLVVVVCPISHLGKWHLGFTAVEGGQRITQLCAVILEGEAGATRQGQDAEVFGVDHETGEPIELVAVENTTKRRLDKQTPLL